jgi:hypothetical protein
MGLIGKGRNLAPIKLIFAAVSAVQRAPIQRVAASGCDNSALPSVSGISTPTDK